MFRCCIELLKMLLGVISLVGDVKGQYAGEVGAQKFPTSNNQLEGRSSGKFTLPSW